MGDECKNGTKKKAVWMEKCGFIREMKLKNILLNSIYFKYCFPEKQIATVYKHFTQCTK